MRERMTADRAETIGLDGLAFLVAMPEQIDRFMLGAGLELSALRARASDPNFLQAVLDCLLRDDAMLAEFCRDQGLDARDIHMAHRVLSGS